MTPPIVTQNNRPSVSDLSALLTEYRRKAEQAGIMPGDPLHAWVETTDRLFESLALRFDENEDRQADAVQRLQEAVFHISQLSAVLAKRNVYETVHPQRTLEGNVLRARNGMLAVFMDMATDAFPFLKRAEYRLLMSIGLIIAAFSGGVVMERHAISQQIAEQDELAHQKIQEVRAQADRDVEEARAKADVIEKAAHEHDSAVAEFESAMMQEPPSIISWAGVIRYNPFDQAMRDQCRSTIRMDQQPPFRRTCSIEITLGAQEIVNAIAGN